MEGSTKFRSKSRAAFRDENQIAIFLTGNKVFSFLIAAWSQRVNQEW